MPSLWNYSRRRFSWPALGIAILFCLMLGLRTLREQNNVASFPFDATGTYFVQRVIDGDTLLLDDGTRVRLFGVDTPETKHPDRPVHPLGVLAEHFTRKHVEGKQVRLQFDKERIDQYNRLLAYVYLPEDDWFLNEELIRAGYSKAEIHFPYSSSMKRRFQEAEAEAKEQQRGLWNAEWQRYNEK